jgi:tRNA-Thr(GGU) m(6)t(6)A37 methyltransferase TsaA
MSTLTLTPIGIVRSERQVPDDDDWDHIAARIELDERFSTEALLGLDSFSHLDVVYCFDRVTPEQIEPGARHPRGRTDWPKVGIFAQRGKNRPNRLGVTTCRLLRLEGRVLHVSGLDAIDGTPVLDLKPCMREFLPRGEVRQPAWATELMRGYWTK